MSGQFETGRVRQKQRTRRELLRAARALIEAGRQPSVADVADHAEISRATAYRYFSTPEAMVQEAVLDAIAAELDQLGALELPTAAEEAPARVERLVSGVLGMTLRHEKLFRAYLAQAVRADGPVEERRGGRRIGWLTHALEPLRPRLPAAEFDRLVHALSLLTGIESVIVLRDVCALEPPEIEATLRWMARALVAAATPP